MGRQRERAQLSRNRNSLFVSHAMQVKAEILETEEAYVQGLELLSRVSPALRCETKERERGVEMGKREGEPEGGKHKGIGLLCACALSNQICHCHGFSLKRSLVLVQQPASANHFSALHSAAESRWHPLC